MTDLKRDYDTAAVKQQAGRGRRSPWPPVVFVFVVGTLLSSTLFHALRRADTKEVALEFRRDSNDVVSAFRESLIHGLDSVVALEALYASTPEVSRAAFRAFTGEHLLEEPGVVFLGWAPLVAGADRATFESSVQAEGAADPELAAVLGRFRIFEAESEQAELATERAEYFPVLFAEPPSRVRTLGFDVASDPVQYEALKQARETREMAVTGRVVIRPDKPDEYGIVVFEPIYTPANALGVRTLGGFAMGKFEVGVIVERAMGSLEPRDIDLVLLDRSADPDSSLLYYHDARSQPGGRGPWTIEDALQSRDLGFAETLRIGDREWLIGTRPAIGYVSSRTTWLPLFALLAGVLLSGSVAGLFWTVLAREVEASRYAQALLAAKEGLEAEAEERERSAKELRQARATQEQILDSLPLNIFLKDAEGRIRFMNDAGLRLLGRPMEEVVGRTDHDLFPEEVADALREVDRRVLAQGEARTEEEQLEVDGRIFHVLAGKTPVMVADSDEPHILGFSLDVTPIKEAQAALEHSEHRFRQLVENMSSGVAVYEAVDDGEEFVFRDYNRAAEQMDGVSREEVIGRRLTEVFPGAEKMGILRLLQDVLRTGEPKRLPLSLYLDERFEAWRENYAYQLPSGEIVVVYDDVSERQRLEADLLHAQKMEAIGRLAGGVAHDFNNLLQVVAGSCDLLLSGKHDASEQERMLRDVRLQAERGAQLVRRLLVFSRRESHVKASIDLGDVVRGAESLVRRLLKENISLAVDLADTPLPITGDQGQLEQVLMNLVVNAADAMPEGGSMQILSGAEGTSEVWFSVADTGPGIPVEAVDRVFDPYFTTKSAAQGTGLGLAVVDGIVSLHQGRIEIDNRPGEGVTFKVVLPRGEQPTEAVRPQATASGALKGNGERVLVVEDQDPVRAVMKTMLSRLRYEVTTAADGATARQCAAAEEFDLLVSDIVLPDTSGVELARELRALTPALGLLLVSGYAQESVRQSASDIRFLQKPFRLADLAQQVAAALRDRADTKVAS